MTWEGSYVSLYFQYIYHFLSSPFAAIPLPMFRPMVKHCEPMFRFLHSFPHRLSLKFQYQYQFQHRHCPFLDVWSNCTTLCIIGIAASLLPLSYSCNRIVTYHCPHRGVTSWGV